MFLLKWLKNVVNVSWIWLIRQEKQTRRNEIISIDFRKVSLSPLYYMTYSDFAFECKESVDTGAKHGNYSVKAVKSTVHCTWNMENKASVCRCQNRLTWWCSSRLTHYFTLNSSYCTKRHIFFLTYLFTNINFCH